MGGYLWVAETSKGRHAAAWEVDDETQARRMARNKDRTLFFAYQDKKDGAGPWTEWRIFIAEPVK